MSTKKESINHFSGDCEYCLLFCDSKRIQDNHTTKNCENWIPRIIEYLENDGKDETLDDNVLDDD